MDERGRGRKGRFAERRGPQPATPETLERAALRYLEQYASSADSLRRVLMRRVERSARAHGTDREAGRQAVAAIVDKLERAGLLDDAGFAEMRAGSLHRRGYGTRRIAHSLRAKGVDEDKIADAVAGLTDEAAEPDLLAALVFARKRQLGPFRAPAERAERRERDLAALARAGFDYDTAKRVVETEDADRLEAEARGG